MSQIYFWNETLHVSGSSSVHDQEFFTVHTAMVYVIHVCWLLVSRSICSCSQAVSKPVWHIPRLCVQWKTPDHGQRNCPKHVVSVQKWIWEISASSWFCLRKFITTHGHMNVKLLSIPGPKTTATSSSSLNINHKNRIFTELSRSFAHTRSMQNCETTTQNNDATQPYEVTGKQSTCRRQGKQENCYTLSTWLWYVILWAFIGPINRTLIPCLTCALALTC